MKKKILSAVSLLMTLICLLVACNGGGNSAGNTPTTTTSATTTAHTHFYGSWVTAKEATCTEDGVKEKACACGKKITETISASHSYEKGVCTKCGDKEFTIILASAPMKIQNNSGSKIVTISSATWDIKETKKDGSKVIALSVSGELSYYWQSSGCSALGLEFTFFDSEGYAVDSYTYYGYGTLMVGDKFKCKTDFTIKPGETIEIRIKL